MDIQTILQKHAGDVGGLLAELSVDTREGRTPADYKAEYEGRRTRRATSVGLREGKCLKVYSDKLKDARGNPMPVGEKIIPPTQIITNFPKKLVRTEVAMMFGGQMHVTASEPNDAFEAFRDVWEYRLGMQDVLMEFAEKVLSETKAAIVFYPKIYKAHWSGQQANELNCRVLSLPRSAASVNDFYPHFDGDTMDAFLYRYQTKDDTGATRDAARLWTRDHILTATTSGAGWEVRQDPNPFGLIPVVYAEIDAPVWEEVASLMDAREMRLSRLADINDYFAEPMLVTIGEVDAPNKNTVGKELQFPVQTDDLTGKTYHGDAKFLSWDQSINSTAKELEETKSEMFAGTSAPDLSFESLKGLGNLSGVARRFMMLDAEIKQRVNMRVFRPAMNRCITIVQAGIANITDIRHKPQLVGARFTVTFDSILPRDPVEDANVLSIASGGRAFNSLATVVSRSPLTPPGDIAGELQRIREDASDDTARTNAIGAVAEE